MPTIQELYQKLIDIHKKIESIEADLLAAKLRCEQAGETEEAYQKYFADVSAILQNNKKFIRTIRLKTEILVYLLKGISGTKQILNLPLENKYLLDHKTNEFHFKISIKAQHINAFNKIAMGDYAKFKANIQSPELTYFDYLFYFTKILKISVLFNKTKLLKFLPQQLSIQVADKIFSQLAIYGTGKNFEKVIQLAGAQCDESPLYWGKLSEHFEKYGYKVFKLPKVASVLQSGNTCVQTAFAIVFGYKNQISAQVPFYPSLWADPTVEKLIAPLAEEVNLHTIRSKSIMLEPQSIWGKPLPDWFDKIHLPYRQMTAPFYNLKEINFHDRSMPLFKELVELIEKHGPVVLSYRNLETTHHVVVMTGYATSNDNKQYILYTNPNYPGKTMGRDSQLFQKLFLTPNGDYTADVPHNFIKMGGLFLVPPFFVAKEDLQLEPFIHNPSYNSAWHPQSDIYSYYGVAEFKGMLDKDFTTWLTKTYKDAYKNEISNDQKIFDICRRLYFRIVEEALATSKGIKSETDPNILVSITKELRGKKYRNPNPMLALRLELAAEALARRDYEGILNINRETNEKLIEKSLDRILELHPKFKDAAPPIKKLDSTTVSSALGIFNLDNLALIQQQNKVVVGHTIKTAQHFKNRATTKILLNAHRFNPSVVAYNMDNAGRVLMILGQMSQWTGETAIGAHQTLDQMIQAAKQHHSSIFATVTLDTLGQANDHVANTIVPTTQALTTVSATPHYLNQAAYDFYQQKADNLPEAMNFTTNQTKFYHALRNLDVPGAIQSVSQEFSSQSLPKPSTKPTKPDESGDLSFTRQLLIEQGYLSPVKSNASLTHQPSQNPGLTQK